MELNARKRDYRIEERGFFPAAFEASKTPVNYVDEKKVITSKKPELL